MCVFTNLIYTIIILLAAVTTEELEGLFAGFLNGVGGHDYRSDMKTCITNPDEITAAVNKVIDDIENISISSLEDAVEQIMTLVGTIPADFSNCTTMTADLTKMETWLSIPLTVDELEKIVTNIENNVAAISTKAAEALAMFETKLYYQCGGAIQAIVADIIGAPATVGEPLF